MYRELLDRFKIPIALSLVGIVLIIGGIISSGLTKQKDPSTPFGRSGQGFPKESLISQKMISVDVSGAVQKSGVYQLKEGSRVEEAIQAAGGFTDSANGEYISKYLNMAQRLSDGSKIYVPAAGESGPTIQTGTVAGSTTQAKVNINTSTQSELEALSGIGPVTASKIISDRPYQKIEELVEKKIVGKATFEKIKDQITIY